ncbi:unnamed protein product [Linum trigynum]|uniref:Uncharacterized protein n=1 Tax=Linum trigynum TaxID=586398 RepID=A0AAV2CGI2_9ROSI
MDLLPNLRNLLLQMSKLIGLLPMRKSRTGYLLRLNQILLLASVLTPQLMRYGITFVLFTLNNVSPVNSRSSNLVLYYANEIRIFGPTIRMCCIYGPKKICCLLISTEVLRLLLWWLNVTVFV